MEAEKAGPAAAALAATADLERRQELATLGPKFEAEPPYRHVKGNEASTGIERWNRKRVLRRP